MGKWEAKEFGGGTGEEEKRSSVVGDEERRSSMAVDGEVPTVDGEVPTLDGEVPTVDGEEGLGSTTASVTTTDFAIGPLVAATASL